MSEQTEPINRKEDAPRVYQAGHDQAEKDAAGMYKKANDRAEDFRKKGNLKAAIAGGAGLGAGIGIGYFRPKKEQRFDIPQKQKDPTAWHDAAIGGIEGAGSFYTTEKLLGKLSKNLGPEHFLNKGLSRLAISGIVGGAGTAAAGYGLNRLVRKKVAQRRIQRSQPEQDQQLSALGKVMQFETRTVNGPNITRTAVAKDRYSKQIKWNEVNRHESDVAKSTLAGAALGGLLRGKRGAGIGGLAGAGLSAGLILNNRSKRDVFGDTSINNRRVERLPYQVGGLAAAGIAGHRLLKYGKKTKLFSSKSRVIQFQDKPKKPLFSGRKWEASGLPRRGEELITRSKRAFKLGQDLNAARTGKPVLDRRGREQTPEWDKPWFRRGAAITAVATNLGGVKFAHDKSETIRGIGRAAGAFAKKVPGVTKGMKFAGEVHQEARDFVKRADESLAERVKRATKGASEDSVRKAAEEKARRDAARAEIRRDPSKDFASRLRLIQFQQPFPVREHQRTRRKKYRHETLTAKQIIAGVGGAVAGGSAVYGYSKIPKRGPVENPFKAAAWGGNVVQGNFGAGGIKAWLNKFKK